MSTFSRVLRSVSLVAVIAGIAPGIASAACESYNNNCVLYARCRVPSLPYGLNTIQDKRRIINTQVPSVGCVAIHNLGTTEGHVSVVTNVRVVQRNGQTVYSVTIQEGNYPLGKIGTRFGNASELNIVGYFKT